MMVNIGLPVTIDEDFISFPAAVRDHLQRARETIARAAPTGPRDLRLPDSDFPATRHLVHSTGFKRELVSGPNRDGCTPARLV
jgi:hypothetical protein